MKIIFKTDLDQTIEYISPEIENPLGYEPDEVIGVHFNNFVLLSNLSKVDAAFQEVISKGKTELLKIRAKSKDGKKISLEIKLIPVFDNQKVIGVHGIAHIISFAEEYPVE